MIGFDFDRTIYWLKDLDFPFPEKAFVITGSPKGRKNEIIMKLKNMGLDYPVLISEYTTKGNNRDQSAIHKGQAIVQYELDTYYDDSEYQLHIIDAYLKPFTHTCQLKLVTKKGTQDFPKADLINM